MIFRKALAIAALFASCLFSVGNLPAQGNSKNDDRIYDEVRMKLAADRDVGRGAVDVVVKDGVVTLGGKVHTDKQKQKAEHLAKKVKGVTSVVNNLKVEYP